MATAWAQRYRAARPALLAAALFAALMLTCCGGASANPELKCASIPILPRSRLAGLICRPRRIARRTRPTEKLALPRRRVPKVLWAQRRTLLYLRVVIPGLQRDSLSVT